MFFCRQSMYISHRNCSNILKIVIYIFFPVVSGYFSRKLFQMYSKDILSIFPFRDQLTSLTRIVQITQNGHASIPLYRINITLTHMFVPFYHTYLIKTYSPIFHCQQKIFVLSAWFACVSMAFRAYLDLSNIAGYHTPPILLLAVDAASSALGLCFSLLAIRQC